MDKIKQIVAKVAQMPPLPRSTVQLMEVLGDEGHTVSDVCRVVESDPALAGNILKVVNSAAFGMAQQVSSLERAVAYLGNKMVGAIALSSSTGRVYEDELEGYEGEAGLLWRHCVCCAVAARELAPFATSKVEPDLAYTAGLLHDIGKSVISEFLAGSGPAIIESISAEKVSDYLDAEQRLLGMDHSQVGAALAEHWNLPEPLKQAIGLHHKPGEADEEYRHLVYVVHLADLIAMMEGEGTGTDALQYHLDPAFETFVAVGAEDLERVLLKVLEEFERTRTVIGV